MGQALSIFAAFALHSTSYAQLPQGNVGSDWELIPEFSDEFNSTTLDTSKWHLFKFMNDEYENGSGIDFITHDRYTWLNSFTSMSDAHRNVFLTVEDGENCLELQIRSDNLNHFSNYLDPNFDTHTAGVVQSNRQFKYGYIEVRAKTAATAVSSAFWLDTVKPNHHREIDVFELYGTSKAADDFGGCSEPVQNKFLSNFLLWNNCGGDVYFDTLGEDSYIDYFDVQNRYPNQFSNGFDHTAEFHTYGLLWESDRMELYVDGVLVNFVDPARVSALAQGFTDQWGNPAEYDWTYPMATLFTMEGFYFLQHSPCENENGPANISDSSFYIDYVRVWRRSASNELISNTSFNSNTSGWSKSTSGGASGSLSHVGSQTINSSDSSTNFSESASGILSFDVSNSGNSRDDAVIRSASFALDSNSVYRASFALRSDEANSTRDERFIKFAVVESGNPGNVIFESNEYVDRDWAEVNHTFSTGNLTGSNYEVQFQCGGSSFLYTCDLESGSAQPGNGIFDNDIEYFLDYVTLGKVGASQTPEGDCNIIEDSKFDDDDGSWTLNVYPSGSNGSFSQASSTGNISISSPGSSYWEVTMSQGSVNLVPNKTYVLEFDGKASVSNKKVNIKVIQSVSPWDTVFEEEVDLAQSFASYQLSFNSGSYSGDIVLDFQVGGQGAHDFEFDNVSLMDQACGVVNPPNPNPSPYGCDQIVNGDFSNGTSDWYLVEDIPNSSANLTEENGQLKFDVSQSGSQYWQVGASQVSLTLEQGFDYKLSFDARANGISAMKARVYSPNPPYTVYLEEEIFPVSGFTSYEAEFSPGVPSNEPVHVDFQMGGQGVGTAFLDNVKLEKSCVSGGGGGGNPPPSQNFGCDQIDNGDFSGGTSDWYLNSGNGGSVASQSVSGGEMHINISNGGNEPWNVGVVQVGRTLEDGETYRLKFDLESDQGGNVTVKIVENAGSYNAALETTFGASSQMSAYSYEFQYSGGASVPAFLEFQFGGEGARNISIDNVRLEKLGCQ